nr:unnamed protein product [Digitaria exilis]
MNMVVSCCPPSSSSWDRSAEQAPPVDEAAAVAGAPAVSRAIDTDGGHTRAGPPRPAREALRRKVVPNGAYDAATHVFADSPPPSVSLQEPDGWGI